jgi:hypothetical protein
VLLSVDTFLCNVEFLSLLLLYFGSAIVGDSYPGLYILNFPSLTCECILAC